MKNLLIIFAVLLPTVFLASVADGASVHTKVSSQEKVKLIRKLSKEAGLPQKGLSQDEVCLEDGCLDAAIDLLRAINFSVDPCKDFYQFSCGRWISNNPVPPSLNLYGQMNVLIDIVNEVNLEILSEPDNQDDPKPVNQAKQAFRTCLDLEEIERVGLAPLNQFISELGGWEILNPDRWNASGFDWLWTEAEIKRRTGKSSIVSMYVLPDMKHTERTILYLDQPEFALPKEVLIAPENYTTLITAYETYIYEVAMELGSIQSDSELRTQIKAMVALEATLANISSGAAEKADQERQYNPYALNDYQAVTDNIDPSRECTIDWKKYLDQVTSSSEVVIAPDEPIIVTEVGYVEKLIPILSEEVNTGRTLANLIVWRAVSDLVVHTTKNMRDIRYRFLAALVGASEPDTRDKYCSTQINNGFGMALGSKYVEKAFDSKAKSVVNEMVENLRATFNEMLEEADWMAEETKSEAIKKAEAIRNFMAYPDWLNNKTAVEEYYKGFELGEGHFANKLSEFQYTTDYGILGILRKPTDRNVWIFHPSVVNAAYLASHNSITFPAGFLQPPFFGKIRPKHQNYGGIGMVIGHEITHGFDNRGSQYDKDGNLQDWWDPVTKEKYLNRSLCMVEQYGKYSVKTGEGNVTLNVNGVLTLGENIGDNGGLRESFRAYQKYIEGNGRELRLPGLEEFSIEQLFFLGFSRAWCEATTPAGLANQILRDPHSPSEWRINGPVRNFQEFAKAYNCPVDADGMNPPPEDQCTVW